MEYVLTLRLLLAAKNLLPPMSLTVITLTLNDYPWKSSGTTLKTVTCIIGMTIIYINCILLLDGTIQTKEMKCNALNTFLQRKLNQMIQHPALFIDSLDQGSLDRSRDECKKLAEFIFSLEPLQYWDKEVYIVATHHRPMYVIALALD